jgi:uncharacterized membrane protein YraQ (UPF0718 family)
MEAVILIFVAVIALGASLIADRRKTSRALAVAGKRMVALLPSFLTMLALVSVALALIPESVIVAYLGGRRVLPATLLASVLGSMTLMPGFVAFPLSGILLSKGVAYMTLSAFTTTLMMVGMLTYPIEKQYFGARVTIIRNALSFAVALVVALATGLYFGEILQP